MATLAGMFTTAQMNQYWVMHAKVSAIFTAHERLAHPTNYAYHVNKSYSLFDKNSKRIMQEKIVYTAEELWRIKYDIA